MSNNKITDLISTILFQHNKIRNDPQSYIPLLKEQMKFIKGNYLQLPKEAPIYTFEGKKAYEEAIAYLAKKKPVNNLTFVECLSKAAQDQTSRTASGIEQERSYVIVPEGKEIIIELIEDYK